MSHYRKIDVRIWNNAKFNSLSSTGKLAFFLLLTHPAMTMFAAMRGRPEGLAGDVNMTSEQFCEGFRELLAQQMAEQDEGGIISLPNFLKYNPPANPNAVRAWGKQAEYLPECELRNVIFHRVKSFAERLGKGFREALLEPFLQSKSIEHRALSIEKSLSQGEGTTYQGKALGSEARRLTVVGGHVLAADGREDGQ